MPDESVKTRVGFLVPLTPTVVKWFRQLRELSVGSAWVLPARTARRVRHHGDTHVGKTTLWAAVTRAFERGSVDVRRFTPHDTRSTAKGHMRNMGIANETTELALNHKPKGMEAVYDVREEIPERRAALELWAGFLSAREVGTPWNVAPLLRRVGRQARNSRTIAPGLATRRARVQGRAACRRPCTTTRSSSLAILIVAGTGQAGEPQSPHAELSAALRR